MTQNLMILVPNFSIGAVTGEQIIRGKKMCFMSDGIQVKGKSVLGSDGKYHYYDANSGVELS
ncbi:hypothetical protein [Lentilactobacillus hilgardii]|uniref:hypothetical protein n=1 Tax=Lentilactobacillus hilgardii TaxID=1588 RepID=UPI00288A6404|nr:hypothetical protein [Lentilactobacillus hilgardii]